MSEPAILRPDIEGRYDAEPNWFARNAAVMEQGFAWLADALRGEGEPARQAYLAVRNRMSAAGEPAAIDRLGDVFSLTPFDLDVLLLGVATLYDPAVGEAMATRRGAATQSLALKLLAGDQAEARALGRLRFGPDGPLRRYRLIGFADANPSGQSAYEPDERIARLLLGEEHRTAAIELLLDDEDHGPSADRHAAQIDPLARRIEPTRPCAVLIGPRRSGRHAAAAALARRFNLGIRSLRPRLLPADPTLRRETIALLSREAALGAFAVLVDADKPDGALAAEDLLHAFDGFVIVVSTSLAETPRRLPTAHFSMLDSADRASIWQKALGRRADLLGPRVEELSEHFALGPGEIARLAATPDLDGAALWDASKALAASGLAGLSERIVPRLGWDDLVLPTETLALLRAIEAQLRHKTRVLGRGGFGAALARGRGTTALFSGQSGVGKTMAAEVLANALALDLHKIDLSSVVSKYIGETERNLRQVFDAAEAGGCVLFFDEADALFGKRTEVKDSHDRYANIEVSYLLQRMESFSGLAILATNLKNNLDPAFLRRLRYVVDIPYPDAVHRETMWRRVFPAQTQTEGLDYTALSRLDLAGGNIAVVAINAAYLAASDSSPVAMRHIEQAARAEFRKLDRDFRGWR